MRRVPSILLLALSIGGSLGACGGEAPDEVQGDLVAVDESGATIAHEAVPGLLEATTTRFAARPASVLNEALPGTRVQGTLRREGDAIILVRMSTIGPGKGPAPGTGDRRPRHGGVVGLFGLLHVEVAAAPDGRIRAYLTDLWRRPIAVRGVTGTVSLDLPGGARVLPFAQAGDALEARMEPFVADSALASVSLVRAGQPLEMTVLLDLTGRRAGARIVPETGCVPPGRQASEGRSPRCTIAFVQTVVALGVSPDGTRAIVAAAHGATTIWKLPEAVLVMGVEPTAPVAVPHARHEPDPRVIAVRPDGTELLTAVEDHLAYFDAATGRFRRQQTVLGGSIVAAVWLPDGARVLVVTAGDGKAHLLDATDGRILRTLETPGQAAAAAIDPTGGWAAIATDVGTIAIADLASATAPRVLTPSLQPVQGLAFAGDRLVTAGSDGTLRIIDPVSATERSRIDLGVPLTHLAVTADGAVAAVSSREGALHVVRLADGTRVERLTWHRATVGVLAFGAGGTLVAGDGDGDLAVWDTGGVGE